MTLICTASALSPGSNPVSIDLVCKEQYVKTLPSERSFGNPTSPLTLVCQALVPSPFQI